MWPVSKGCPGRVLHEPSGDLSRTKPVLDLGGAFVTVMETTNARPCDDSSSPSTARSFSRSLLLEPAMRAILVVVVDVGSEQSLQMGFVNSNHVIDQFPTAATDPALSNSVLPRTMNRRPNGCDAQGTNRFENLSAVLAVVIENEEPRGQFVREGFAQLLHDPGARRMARDVEVEDVPPIMANDEKAVQHTECLERFSADKGWVVLGVYKDEGWSGSPGPQPVDKRDWAGQ